MNKERLLHLEMARLGIREEDIVEMFIRSAGPGGQNVNKTSTRVYLKHLPSGIEVKCQKERSQAQNRYIARKLLIEKIEASATKKLAEEKRRIEKKKRQARKRPKALQLRILEEKRRHSFKKKLRAKIQEIE
ncbi:MAG: peptide chain release factor 1 [Omnitrophica WOR_2 bacterium RBG_13_44_8b]|nr:MAG: peptide chain release factor 1 [Omnitrophica WOR_2 bacterium RBG_13_44_8b]